MKKALCLQKNLFIGILLGNALVEVGCVGVNLSTDEYLVQCFLSRCSS